MSKLPHLHGQTDKLLEKIEKAGDFNSLAESFKLLSDGTRLKLFWVLCHTKECVLNLSKIMNASSPCLSHHLKILKNLGLIVSERSGKEMLYTASDSRRAKELHNAIERLQKISCPTEK
ncbi:MAG: winged helix-turn-helix transcriptional regulator [Clostridia bacterium]|nr:winged helix-turn-helix transcriptional regulator [Clostridia bacterium]